MDDLNSSLVKFFKDDHPWDTQRLEELIKEGVNLNGPLSKEDGSRPLHVAATKGDVSVVQTLLDHGAYVEVPDYYGNTPSHYASREGHLQVLEMIINRGANIDLLNDEGFTVLEIAVRYNHVDVTRLLSKRVDKQQAQLALFDAVEKERVGIVKEMLKAGIKMNHNVIQLAVEKGNIELAEIITENADESVNSPSPGFDSPLNIAIKAGHYNIAKMLVEKCSKVSETNRLKGSLSTALHHGNYEIAKLLFDKGAEISEHELIQELNVALRSGFLDTVRLILDVRPDILNSSDLESMGFSLPNCSYNSTLHNAIICGDVEIIQLILERMKNVNKRGLDEKTPLILATEKALMPVIKLLLEKGADVSLYDKMGRTAFSYALLGNSSIDIIEMLVKKGVPVNANMCMNSKLSPLHVAARTKNKALIQFLLQKHAKVNARDEFGNTPLLTLIEAGANDDWEELMVCAKMLLEKGANLNTTNNLNVTPMIKAIESFSTDSLKTFVETIFSTSKGNVSTIITQQVLSDMVLNGHISLIREVLNEIAEFHIKVAMQMNNDYLSKASDNVTAISSKSFNQNEVHVNHLYFAAYKGDMHLAHVALQSGININTKSEEGVTPLQIAIYRCNFKLAKYLIDKGANLNIKDKYQLLPLQLAIILGDVAFVKYLCNKTPLGNQIIYKNPLLIVAAYHGNVDLLSLILKQQSDINVTDENENTILHIAVRTNNNWLVNYSIENGVNVNAQNIMGDTAFHMALNILNLSMSSNNLQIAVNLFNQGVDINIPNSKGKTALHLATAHNLTPFIRLLLEKGVKDINARDKEGRTPFQQMVLNIKHLTSDASSLIVLFLKNGATTKDILMDSGYSFLEELSKSEFIDFERVVLEFFSNNNPWKENGMFSLMETIFRENRCHLVQKLLAQGFTFNELYFSGVPLDLLFYHKCSDVQKMILKNDKKLEIDPSYLFKAIKQGDLEIVKILLDKLDVNTIDKQYDRSTLQSAFLSEYPKFGLAQLFLDRGVKVENALCFKDSICSRIARIAYVRIGYVPLILAAQFDNGSMVNILLDKGGNINVINFKGESPLQMAIRNDNHILVGSMLKRGAKALINLPDEIHSRTPLHYAAKKNSEITKLLLDKGANPFVADREKMTPIHIAAESGNHKTVKLFLNQVSALVLVQNHKGDTPLHTTKSAEVAKILISKGASVNAKNAQNQSPLHCVNIYKMDAGNSKEITELLISKGARVRDQDKTGKSPLHFAAQNPNVGSLSVLIRKGAELDMKDHCGRTPLHCAIEHNWPENITLLLNQGASLEVKNKSGLSPLMLAVKFEKTDLLLILVENGASLDAKDYKGCTALHHAVLCKNSEAIKCLLLYGASPSERNDSGQTPFELAKIFSIRKMLGYYIQCLKIAGFFVNEDVDTIMNPVDKQKCLQELEYIKATHLSEDFALIDIFSKVDRPRYLFEENVKKQLDTLFQSPAFHTKFPFYADILKSTVIKSKRSSYYLRRRAIQSMMSEHRIKCCQKTPDLAWENVINCLSDRDLINVLKSESYNSVV